MMKYKQIYECIIIAVIFVLTQSICMYGIRLQKENEELKAEIERLKEQEDEKEETMGCLQRG